MKRMTLGGSLNRRTVLSAQLAGIFFREIQFQGSLVEMALHDMNSYLQDPNRGTDTVRFWYACNAALGALANIGNILWPAQSRKGSKQRAAELRKLLGVGDASLLALHDVRNGLVHFDERLDAWHRTTERGIFVDRYIGASTDFGGLAAGDIARRFDPATLCAHVFGANMDLQAAANEVFDLVDLIDRRNDESQARRMQDLDLAP